MLKTEQVKHGKTTYNVVELTARERRVLLEKHTKVDPVSMQSEMIRLGVKEFKDDPDIERILDLPSSLFDTLSGAVMRLSGFGNDEKKP